MSYSVILTDHFRKEAKKLTRKYRSLKAELKALGDELAENPTTGTPLGYDLYKVRLAIASKGKVWRGQGHYLRTHRSRKSLPDLHLR